MEGEKKERKFKYDCCVMSRIAILHVGKEKTCTGKTMRYIDVGSEMRRLERTAGEGYARREQSLIEVKFGTRL